MIEPLPFVWRADLGAMVPHTAFLEKARAQYEDRASYRLAEEQLRSEVSHNHEFAFVATAWKNLPEGLADQYPTAEHLRKRALIEAGYYDEQIMDVGTNAAALRVAVGVRSFPGEDFSLVIVRGPLVVIRRPKSQSRRAMGVKDFQASKDAILGVISELIGVEPDVLANMGR